MIKTKEEVNLLYLQGGFSMIKASILRQRNDLEYIESNDETRQAVIDLGDTWLIFLYAYKIDHKPRDDTRKAASATPEAAYWYARVLDRGFHPDTFIGVMSDPSWHRWYLEDFGGKND